jgi:hypothetical protein
MPQLYKKAEFDKSNISCLCKQAFYTNFMISTSTINIMGQWAMPRPCSSSSKSMTESYRHYKLNKLIENADTVRFIKSGRIARLGHVMWMDDTRTSKRILE